MQLVYRKLQGMRAEQVTAQPLAKLDAEANAAARSSFGQILRFVATLPTSGERSLNASRVRPLARLQVRAPDADR